MKTATTVCGRCGAKISGDGGQEVCPACLLESGLGLIEDEPVAGGDLSAVAAYSAEAAAKAGSAKADDPGHDNGVVNPGLEESVCARDGKKATRSARQGESVPRTTTILSHFGDYEVLEEIGRGGQGVVYRAHQKSLNRTVALKVIGLGPWTTETHLKRFRREAEAAAHLEHPCIVPIYEVGERDGQCYFSMKFVEGGQLDEVVKHSPMSIRQSAELVAKVARTVHYAHEHGILHRDIKPGNILLDQNGEPHLTDFGLARLVEAESTVTATLDVLGTPSYMAPEQAAGDTTKVSKSTDVYGLGAVLYQLLTGHPPFAGGTTYETIKLLLESEPRQPRLLNSKIDRDLSTICLKCLEKDPQRRYSSALGLAEDLEHWLKDEPIQAHRTGICVRGKKWVRRNPVIAALIISLVALAAAIAWNVSQSTLFHSGSEKSIAILPFENLGGDPDNAYVADALQDEILTDLARIADLKVIGSTSVIQYKSGIARDVRKIGHELGVANFVEGSVRPSGNRMRVNVRLVDTHTQRELWGQTYDRDLSEFSTIEGQIAIAIAEELHTKLSPNEKSEIERPATSDMAALNLYTRAETLLLTSFSSVAKTKLLAAADLLDQAVARDPSFFQAYCRLAYTHDRLYFLGIDHTPARLALADAAVQAAFRLRPDAGEAHLARAEDLYQGYLDYDGALAEVELARRSLPNQPRLFALEGYIKRRQGQWEESTRDLERSIELDPHNFYTLQQIALSYGMLHRYPEESAVLERALAIQPDNVDTKVALAAVQFHWKADTKPLHQTIDSIRTMNPGALPSVANDWLSCALAERDLAAARNALDALGDMPLTDYTVHVNRALMEGVIARIANDDAKARAALTTARTEQEKIFQAQPDYGPALCVLGLIDAALGRKQEALQEGRRAVELVPTEKEAISAPLMIEYLAMIAAWVGDKDLACQQLTVAVRPPSTISYGQLKLLPYWDPLRGDPRFEYITASLAPKGVANSESEKSIAVLPFENLSNDPNSAYFAEGVQEEILTRLAKIGDLRVISRTSTQRYQSKPRALAEIAKQLGVASILEGSVQKVADQVRVNVQLINAQTDSHLWAESYDQKLTDILGVESEIAKRVAESLQAKLNGGEEQLIAAKPTDNIEAYDAYLRGLAYALKAFPTRPNALGAQRYFKEAVRLDPKFAPAWALLSFVDSRNYLTQSLPPTVALCEEARQAAETALTLQPNLGEAVLAKGSYYYYCLKDYDTAVRYFEEARQLLPNSSRIPELLAYLARRRGQWDRSEAYFNEAERLDPLSASLLVQQATNYICLRRFPEALRKFDEALDITPDDLNVVVQKAAIAQAEGDLPGASALLARLRLAADDIEGLETQVYQAILERRPAPVIPFVKEILAKPDPASGYFNGELRFWLGWAQEVAGDHVGARESWRQARSEMEPFLKEQPDNYSLIGDLALINMSLGDKAAALALSERAIAANPVEKDAVTGPIPIEILARVAARMGETDRAIAALQKLLSIPYSGSFAFGVPLTPALLRLDPMFDPLRNDPRFQKLCEEKQP